MADRVCCQWLDDRLRDAGEKGLSIFPRQEAGLRSFFLVGRSLELGLKMPVVPDPAALALVNYFKKEGAENVSITLEMALAIRHCPGCGADLARWITENSESFDALRRRVRGLTDIGV